MEANLVICADCRQERWKSLIVTLLGKMYPPIDFCIKYASKISAH